MSSEAPRKQGLVLRNTLVLVGAQVAGVPLSIVVSAMTGRYLGAEEFGYASIAWTLAGFGFLLVEWGQGGVLPARVARDRGQAAELLGTALGWRLGVALVVYGILAAGSAALGYEPRFQAALGLVVLQSFFATVSLACQDVIRGFERTDVTAYAQMGQQLVVAVLVIPTLLFGGRLIGMLAAQAIASGAVALFVWRAIRRIGVRGLAFSKPTARTMFFEGYGFFIFGAAMALQPNVDAILLSKLAPIETVGYQAAARKLIGVLVLPAAALTTALYPTLSRLYSEDLAAFRETTRNALRGTAILAVPVALGCALFREVGISIFSRHAFGPAQGNLLILSAFLLLVYLSMPLGTAILAAGKQRAWAFVQFGCVIVSVVVDPLLIPVLQARYGNGGLGVCVAAVISEVLMVGAGMLLVPSGVLDRSVALSLLRAALAGVAMAGVARLLGGITPYVAAPLAGLAYVAALWAVGGLSGSQLALFRAAISRRRSRA